MNIDQYKNIFFVGIGGIGMSALARYFNKKNKSVYGYDMIKSDLCKQLEYEGIDIIYNDIISNIFNEIYQSDTNETLIIYTPAIPFDNSILQFFNDRSFKVIKRSEALGYISKDAYTVAIAGTHGKTTTSTILAHILESSGNNPTAFLGGISHNYKTNFLFSESSSILIVEADEFDRSFLHLHADIAIITSIDIDHLDVYKDKKDLLQAFNQFVAQIKINGFLLIEDSVKHEIEANKLINTASYSTSSICDYYAENISCNKSKMIFDMNFSRNKLINNIENSIKNIELNMPGKHNVSNAMSAIIVSSYVGIDKRNIKKAIKTFNGVYRRFDIHIDNKKLVYIDDYAHHPEEVLATINTTKKMYPSRKITVVFQPHLFSRTKDFANEFSVSLKDADDLVLLDIFPARENPIKGIDSYMLLNLCTNNAKEVCPKDALIPLLKSKKIDILLTLGAGDVSSLVQPIKHMLN
jgi:UDP-N-acetylmuramate--alanine ligase